MGKDDSLGKSAEVIHKNENVKFCPAPDTHGRL